MLAAGNNAKPKLNLQLEPSDFPRITNTPLDKWSTEDVKIWLSCIQFTDDHQTSLANINDTKSGDEVGKLMQKNYVSGAILAKKSPQELESFLHRIGIENEGIKIKFVEELEEIKKHKTKCKYYSEHTLTTSFFIL